MRATGRLWAVLVGVVLLLGILVGRLAQMQVLDADRYRSAPSTGRPAP